MKNLLYYLLAIIILSSCGVQYKQVPYFQNLTDTGVIQEDIINSRSIKIQSEDILAITVASLNAEASAIFNLGNTSTVQSSDAVNLNPVTTSNGFRVDQEGFISLPVIGLVRVAGLTTSQARILIQEKLTPFLKEPVVGLRLINFKVSILGDVTRPGMYPIQNERLTVTEALSLAGDLTITAVRNNVLLIRESGGKREYIRLDLQNKDLFSSPYFYMQNNDVLYVQPSNAKYASVDSSYRNVSILLSALSVIAILISRF